MGTKIRGAATLPSGVDFLNCLFSLSGSTVNKTTIHPKQNVAKMKKKKKATGDFQCRVVFREGKKNNVVAPNLVTFFVFVVVMKKRKQLGKFNDHVTVTEEREAEDLCWRRRRRIRRRRGGGSCQRFFIFLNFINTSSEISFLIFWSIIHQITLLKSPKRVEHDAGWGSEGHTKHLRNNAEFQGNRKYPQTGRSYIHFFNQAFRSGLWRQRQKETNPLVVSSDWILLKLCPAVNLESSSQWDQGTTVFSSSVWCVLHTKNPSSEMKYRVSQNFKKW